MVNVEACAPPEALEHEEWAPQGAASIALNSSGATVITGSAPDRVVIRHNNASVAQGNRFILPDEEDLVVEFGESIDFEPTPSGWRVKPSDK